VTPEGIVAVLRGSDPWRIECTARALLDGGVRFLEVTFTVPEASALIEKLSALQPAIVGAGTVISRAQAREAARAGARFMVSPGCRIEVSEEARTAGVPCVLGGLTPTEVLAAWEAGCEQVKVFPAGRVGGARYLQDLAGPFPQMHFMPSGGIAIDDLPSYALPCVASVALGGELAPPAAVAAGDWAQIRDRAARATAALGPQG
jgi:2-dehydro-3-deoxyphosphogluconate aldolase/(4S)-4-hydroxy-2-oxoglutarate aldolase